uniref:Uncharacterized protein n=1 Tax=Salmonella phage vB_SEnST11_KE23 TaxID=3161174 RepID=A0AAU8GF18_9CAUD
MPEGTQNEFGVSNQIVPSRGMILPSQRYQL